MGLIMKWKKQIKNKMIFIGLLFFAFLILCSCSRIKEEETSDQEQEKTIVTGEKEETAERFKGKWMEISSVVSKELAKKRKLLHG